MGSGDGVYLQLWCHTELANQSFFAAWFNKCYVYNKKGVWSLETRRTLQEQRPLICQKLKATLISHVMASLNTMFYLLQLNRNVSLMVGFLVKVFFISGFIQDGGLLINNPTALAIHESKCLWPNTPVQCVVSLGTGRYETATKTSSSTYTSLKTKLTNVISSATDTEGEMTESHKHICVTLLLCISLCEQSLRFFFIICSPIRRMYCIPLNKQTNEKKAIKVKLKSFLHMTILSHKTLLHILN